MKTTALPSGDQAEPPDRRQSPQTAAVSADDPDPALVDEPEREQLAVGRDAQSETGSRTSRRRPEPSARETERGPVTSLGSREVADHCYRRPRRPSARAGGCAGDEVVEPGVPAGRCTCDRRRRGFWSAKKPVHGRVRLLGRGRGREAAERDGGEREHDEPSSNWLFAAAMFCRAVIPRQRRGMINIPNRSINLLISDEEMAGRRAEQDQKGWKPVGKTYTQGDHRTESLRPVQATVPTRVLCITRRCSTSL